MDLQYTTLKKPLKIRLAEHLREEMLSGARMPGTLLESERKLCEKHEVSRVTAREALKILESEGLIRRRPRREAIILGSSGGKLVGSLGNKNSRIAFLRQELAAASRDMLEGIQRFCSQESREVDVFDAKESEESLLRWLEHCPEDVAGVILAPTHTECISSAIREAVKRNLALVSIGRKLEVDVSSVSADNFTIGYLATDHLLEQVHRPVFHVGGSLTKPSWATRRNLGWQAALAAHGYNKWEPFLLEPSAGTDYGISRNEMHSGHEIGKILFSTPPVDGDGWSIFANSDYFAQGIYMAAREAGLKVGVEVKVVGVDDLPFAAKSAPPMSTVRISSKAVGYTAARLLSHRIENPTAEVVHQIVPVRLIERESSLGLTKTPQSKLTAAAPEGTTEQGQEY